MRSFWSSAILEASLPPPSLRKPVSPSVASRRAAGATSSIPRLAERRTCITSSVLVNPTPGTQLSGSRTSSVTILWAGCISSTRPWARLNASLGVSNLVAIRKGVATAGMPYSVTAPAEAVTEYGIPAVATPLRMATKLETPREAFSRAQGRVEEMHPAQRIVTELVLDPLNWVPGFGFTKTEDVMQVLRSAKRGIEEVAPAARRLATEGETGFLKLGGGKEASRIAELQKERMALAAERRELQTSIQNVPGQETPANIARNDELTARLYELDTQIRQAGERGSLSIPGGERPIDELPLFKGEEPLGIPPNMPTVKLTPREGLILNAQTGQPIEVTAWRASPDTPPKELQPRLARSYALDRSMAQPEGALGQAPYHVEEKVVRLENPLVVEGLQGDLLDLWASRGDIVAKGLADESAKLGRPPMGWYRRADNYIAEKAADLGHDGILYKAGYRSEVVELRPLAGVSPRAAPEPPKGLTPEAEALLRKVDEGGVPLYTTDPLERIARENDVDPSGKAPNQIIDELRQRAGGPAEPPAGAPGPSAEAFPSPGSPTIRGKIGKTQL